MLEALPSGSLLVSPATINCYYRKTNKTISERELAIEELELELNT